MSNPLHSASSSKSPKTKEEIANEFAPDPAELEEEQPRQQEQAIKSRVRTSQSFDEKYKQFTSYIDRNYEEPFNKLIDALGNTNKKNMFNEAIYDLLLKYAEQLAKEGINVVKLPRTKN